MKKVQLISSIISCLFIIITIFTISCGGGGGDGGGGGTPSITYSGLTTQATVSQSNATDISQNAISGGNYAITMGTSISGAVAQGNTSSSGHSLPFQLPKIFEDSLSKINLSSGKIIAGAILSVSGNVPGNCGGSASYNLMANDRTGDFSGQLIFNNYCDDNIIMSGGFGISGNYNLNTNKFTTFNFDFQDITFTEGGDSGILKGNFSCSVSGSTVTVTEDLLVKNNAENKVYWFNNYSLMITTGSNYRDITGSGTFYVPDYGYVTISTITPFRLYSGYTNPSSGVMKCTGRNNTSALFTALTSSTYRVQADTDGDNVYDWDSGVKTYP